MAALLILAWHDGGWVMAVKVFVRGGWGWGLLGVVVLVVDGWQVLLRRETMSSAFDRWLCRPEVACVLVGAWSGLSWHLFGRWVRRLLG